MLTLETIKDKFRARDTSLYASKEFLESLALLYHDNSKFSFWDAMAQGAISEALNTPYMNARASKPYKIHPGSPFLSFQHYQRAEGMAAVPSESVFSLLQHRRSTRSFEPHSISLNELYLLLHATYGITYQEQDPSQNNPAIEWNWRVVPSAGALYPLEIYVLVFDAQIQSGLYHYCPKRNGIELLNSKVGRAELEKATNAGNFLNLDQACMAVLVTGVFERTFIKYRERGYRFILQESGFALQNLALATEALGLGSCLLGGFMDEEINQLLNVDGVFESILGVQIIGKKCKQLP